MRAPLVGITSDIVDGRYRVARSYARLVAEAGGVPVLLACRVALVDAYLERCEAFVLSGGDDPRTEPWGEPTHPGANPVHADRQVFETALLEALRAEPPRPVLGVCLGMQMMALCAGGALDQHLPETLATADRHWGHVVHPIRGPFGRGHVLSHHRQAVRDPGSLSVVAEADDGVIEAVRDERRPFYLGVQWHPERTEDPALGAGIIAELVGAAVARKQ